jgi:hypothetical protein
MFIDIAGNPAPLTAGLSLEVFIKGRRKMRQDRLDRVGRRRDEAAISAPFDHFGNFLDPVHRQGRSLTGLDGFQETMKRFRPKPARRTLAARTLFIEKGELTRCGNRTVSASQNDDSRGPQSGSFGSQ